MTPFTVQLIEHYVPLDAKYPMKLKQCLYKTCYQHMHPFRIINEKATQRPLWKVTEAGLLGI